MSTARTISVSALARVEGEGGIKIRMRNSEVADVELNIFEPPRFFEAFLRGRHYAEVPDITARICGICPVAYLISAVNAFEDAYEVQVEPAVRTLRRLLYCGEWIESHALHVFLLHAPDFLGFEDAVRMAAAHRDVVEMGLQLKKVGNDIVTLLGGREVHPVNVRVGGFYRIPSRSAWAPIRERLKWAREAALTTVQFASALTFPEFDQNYEFVAMRHEQDYAITEGRIVSNRGVDIPVQEYEAHFQEVQSPHSTSLHSVHIGAGNYLVGPLARFNLNFDRLSPLAQEAARSAGVTPPCLNGFKSIVVRAVELLHVCDEALSIVENYPVPDRPAAAVEPRPSIGYGCSEAPRGILYHRYQTDAQGIVLDARIVPPTAQNQGTIESDLSQFVPSRVGLSKERLTWECEQLVRNYDPCISCSTHFLHVQIENEDDSPTGIHS
jgi:coenzyme F420-reducing hydrogenase alpha subunit